jgi:phosphatidylserine/phosphatidylglycerophosphate/cardiolipin synthase-like enzyme
MRCLIFALCLIATPALTQTMGHITVCFVPGPKDCASVVAAEIAKAQQSIDMQAYGFTEPQIAQALLDAHDRGVKIRLISDKTGPHEKGGKVEVLAVAGIPVWIDYVPRIAHNKVIIIDGNTALTGSLNWTVSANRRNAENLLVVRDPVLAQAFEANFESRLQMSEPLNQYESDRSR